MVNDAIRSKFLLDGGEQVFIPLDLEFGIQAALTLSRSGLYYSVAAIFAGESGRGSSEGRSRVLWGSGPSSGVKGRTAFRMRDFSLRIASLSFPAGGSMERHARI